MPKLRKQEHSPVGTGARTQPGNALRNGRARVRPTGVMIRQSNDGHRLTAQLEPGGPCVAVAERQPDGRWLINGRAMSHERADIAPKAAVTVSAGQPAASHSALLPGAAAGCCWRSAGAAALPPRHRRRQCLTRAVPQRHFVAEHAPVIAAHPEPDTSCPG